MAIFTIFEAFNFDFYETLPFLEAEIYQINKIQNPAQQMAKNANFRTSRFSKIDFT